MPTLLKDDETAFTLQAYHEVLIGDRASVSKRIRLLAKRHDHFVNILKRYTDHYEIAFFHNPDICWVKASNIILAGHKI